MKYNIKEASKITATTIHTLRYYDKISLVSPKRLDNNYRYYSEDDILLIKYIKVMKQANFTLEEIAIMINHKLSFSRDCDNHSNITTLLDLKCKQLEHKIQHLKQTITIIETVKNAVINKNQSDSELIDKLVLSLYDDLDGGDN